MMSFNKLKTAMASGGKVVILRNDDENLATWQAVAVAEAVCQPVIVMSCHLDKMQTALEEHSSDGIGTLIIKGGLSVYGGNPIFGRSIREVALQQRKDNDASRLILIETSGQAIPDVLGSDVDVIDAELPSVKFLERELGVWLDAKGLADSGMPDDVRYILATAVKGLARHEASRLFSRCFTEQGKLDATWLRIEKARMVSSRLDGAISFEKVPNEEVGGLDVLKAWTDSRMAAFNSQAARDYGLEEPSGLLIVGIPGTGKSLTAKTIARSKGLPLLKLDIGKLFGSLVGQSESQARAALDTAEACSPCVLWIDEIEKGLAGSAGGGDSGTSQRVFGTILTWLNDKTSPVFVVATANDVSALPPELLRKGRFDEIFYVGLPVQSEREDILDIHLKAKNFSFPADRLSAMARLAKGFNGAELAEAVKAGMFDSFNDGRPLEPSDVEKAIKETVPLSKTMAEQIKRLERWADGRARRASSKTEKTTNIKGRFARIED